MRAFIANFVRDTALVPLPAFQACDDSARRRSMASQCDQLDGFTHSFQGYYSCALDKKPCASKVREKAGLTFAECARLCNGCSAISVFGGRECWIYRTVAGERIFFDESVLCVHDRPLATTYARLQEFRDVLTSEVAGSARVE